MSNVYGIAKLGIFVSLDHRVGVHSPDMLHVEIFAVEDGATMNKVLGEQVTAALATHPDMKFKMLNINMALPLILGSESRCTAGKVENTVIWPRVLLFEMTIQTSLVLEPI
jgi:hypothetical protein